MIYKQILRLIYRNGLNIDSIKFRLNKTKNKMIESTLCRVADHDWYNSSSLGERSRTCSQCKTKVIMDHKYNSLFFNSVN